MKIKRLFSLVVVCSMLFCMPVMAAENNLDDGAMDEELITGTLEDVEVDLSAPIEVSEEVYEVLVGNSIQPYVTTPDNYEENNSPATAVAYNSVATLTNQVSSNNDLYRLGMKSAGLHSATDEDWYYITLDAGQTYFVDLRNIGCRDWYIELYYLTGDIETSYYYTTNPAVRSEFQGAAEKYFYFTAQDSGTFFIRISSGNDWVDSMYYFFYVGPYIQTFNIVDLPTYGGVNLFGTSYQTYTCDLRNAFPATTAITSISISDSFSNGSCSHLSKYMSAGGRTYYNSVGSDSIGNIQNVSLGQLWTFGAKCSQNMHSGVHWSARINGRFRCIMEPYPGNEINF